MDQLAMNVPDHPIDDNDPLDEQLELHPDANLDVNVYTRGKLAAGAYIGGPFVATYMLARNFAAIGDRRKAGLTWIIGITISLLIFAGLFSLPEELVDKIPNVLVPLLYMGMAVGLFQRAQLADVEAHLAADGALASGWRVAGVSILGLVVTLAMMVPVIFMMPAMEGDVVEVGALEHEVFYDAPITEAEARSVGAALDRVFFSELGFETYMKIERRDGGYVALFPVEDNTWEHPDTVAFYLSLGPVISAALSDAQVTVVLFYEGFGGRDDHEL